MEVLREREPRTIPQGTEWSQTARKYDAVCRDSAEALGLDGQKLRLGHLLRRFRGDDRSAYFPIEKLGLNPNEQFDISAAQWSRTSAMDRLDWEISSDVTPDPLREQLEEAKQEVSKEDFQTRESGERALKIWLEKRAWFIAEMPSHPDWSDAETYYRENLSTIQNYLYIQESSENERYAA